MKNIEFRTVSDSMGDLRVPEEALYGAQTQRAIENFPISDLTLPKSFIQAVALIKAAAAHANHELNLLPNELAQPIIQAAQEVISGKHYEHFPIDVFQTGSGTSTNMNTNEVLARLASLTSNEKVHPNDHVNMSQSSNDVIPTAIHLSVSLQLKQHLGPALTHLKLCLHEKAQQLDKVTKTGRTHLMDAMPVTMGQEIGGWAAQVEKGILRIEQVLSRLHQLPIGGTAVGTGINAHPSFRDKVCQWLSHNTQINFQPNPNPFEGLSTQDTVVELSGQLKTIAVSLMKIANDLRWMNSGPLAGFGEIALPALQPGSSIMPGKVNPVIPEAVMMLCAQVMGNDTTITVAGQSGNFQLNVMLPVIAYNILQSVKLLANGSKVLADKAITDFKINEENLKQRLEKNPILVTALNSVIGYELGAKIAKTAYAQGRSLKEVALELTDLSESELDHLLDPYKLTLGGIPK